MLIGRSPVRISFAGGGTDLPAYFEQFGGAVLSTAINKYFYTILGKRTDDRIQIISSDLRVFETSRDIAAMKLEGSELEIPFAVLKDMSLDISLDLFLASEIPPGTGLGSSASVCVNILKTLTTYLDRPLSRYELAERAFHIARNVLSRTVGKQDEYASAFGGLNFITFERDGSAHVEPIKIETGLMQNLQANLMLFFTGSAHHSWTILEEQEKLTRTHGSPAVEALHQVRSLAYRMRDSLERGDLNAVGLLMDEAWQAKKRVSTRISNPRIDHLYELAQRAGAIGGKITGAGGGGFLLLYCEPDNQAAVRKALTAEGPQEMAFAFDFQGAQVIVNDPFIDGDERTGSRWTFVRAAS
jgi:D-glycero-alpha-D-manno-heptose-7-phosphate kinase